MTVKKNVYELFAEIEAEEAEETATRKERAAQRKAKRIEKVQRGRRASRVLGAFFLMVINAFYVLLLVIGFHDIGGLASVAFLAVFLPPILFWNFKRGVRYLVL